MSAFSVHGSPIRSSGAARQGKVGSGCWRAPPGQGSDVAVCMKQWLAGSWELLTARSTWRASNARASSLTAVAPTSQEGRPSLEQENMLTCPRQRPHKGGLSLVAAILAAGAAAVQQLRQPHVRQLGPSIPSQQDVVRFYLPVGGAF